MDNPQALEWFAQRDKKSLWAGIVYGQGLKGRARAAQNPAPAGFPQNLWNAAQERANAMITAMTAEESGETPSNSPFDQEAFCVGTAIGRSLEGWELDGRANLPDGWAEIIYYVHFDEPRRLPLSFGIRNVLTNKTPKINIDWGDGSPAESHGIYLSERYISHDYSHDFQLGDYAITIILPCEIRVKGWADSLNECLYSVYLAGIVTGIEQDSFSHCINLQSFESSTSCLTSIGAGDKTRYQTFYGCTALTSVTIPDGVTNIGGYAFYGCASLTSFTIPDSVRYIQFYAFANCAALTSVTIPDSVKGIEYEAFENCYSLTSVTIGNGVTSIDDYAFHNCASLTSLTIGNSVTRIRSGAFYGCARLSDVYYAGTKEQWDAITIDNNGNAALKNAAIHYNSTGPDDVHDD